MRPVSAEFVASIGEGDPVLTQGLPAVALVGRSNVGKSSLINALVKRRIARSGSNPGTTRLINVYRVSTPPSRIRPFLLVDLPGYGYTRGGTQARRTFDALTRGFFEQVTVRTQPPASDGVRLAGIVLVVDVRHPGLESDLAALSWSLEHQYSVIVVATKADRISRAAGIRASRDHLRAIAHPDVPDASNASAGLQPVPLVTVSTETGKNLGQVWAKLKELLRLL